MRRPAGNRAAPGGVWRGERDQSASFGELARFHTMQGSHSSTATVTKQKERSAASLSPGAATFQWATWTVFVLQVWVLDFGRPVITFLLPTSASPFSWLSFSKSSHNTTEISLVMAVIPMSNASLHSQTHTQVNCKCE